MDLNKSKDANSQSNDSDFFCHRIPTPTARLLLHDALAAGVEGLEGRQTLPRRGPRHVRWVPDRGVDGFWTLDNTGTLEREGKRTSQRKHWSFV